MDSKRSMILDRKCDFCSNKAVADGATKMGVWAYMCESCLKKYGFPNSKITTYIDGRELGGSRR